MIKDILNVYDEPQEFFYKFKVNKKHLANAFTNIGKVLGKTSAKIFALAVKDGVLTIRAGSSVFYKTEIEILEGDKPDDLEVVAWYVDITKMLKNSKEVEITVSPTYMSLHTEHTEVSLELSDAYVDNTPEIVGSQQKVTTVEFVSALRGFSSLLSLTNLFTQYNVIYAQGPVIQMKFPSIWVELDTHPIHNTFTLDMVKTIISFLGTATSFVLHENQSYMILQHSNEYLMLPITEKPNIQPLAEFTENFDSVGRVSIDGLLTKLVDLLSVVGKSDASLLLFEKGAKVIVDTERVSTQLSVGNIEGGIIQKINTRLEFLVNLIPLLGNIVYVKRRGSLVLLESSDAKVLISTI